MAMISFTVRMRFEPSDHEEIEHHLIELSRQSRLEPGCVSYIAHFVEDDPNTVLIYEQYKDEAAVEFHGTTPHFAQHAIGGLYQKMRDRSREALIAIS